MPQVPFNKFSRRFNPYSKISNQANVVCRFWVKGVCTKGDSCEFKHSYESSQAIECYFFKTSGKCNNPKCTYLHPDREKVTKADEKPVEIKSCPDYDKGFCLAGQECKYRHLQKMICTNYLTGFCPYGPQCQQVHFDGFFDEEECPDVSDKTVGESENEEEEPKDSAEESKESEDGPKVIEPERSFESLEGNLIVPSCVQRSMKR